MPAAPMRYRPAGRPAEDPRLGRYIPDDWEHVTRYPLTALMGEERPRCVPVVIGVNWYSAFDVPEQDPDGTWWIGRGDLGRIRGGHAVCLPPRGAKQPASWRRWHDQVAEGICVKAAWCRAMAILNRRRYQPRPGYDLAQTLDEWPGGEPAYSGTSVRAGAEVLLKHGAVPALRGEPMRVGKGEVTRPFVPAEGIQAYRWITDMTDLDAVLGLGGRDWAPLDNSWGDAYPRVRVPLSVLDRLLREQGEFAVPTDR